MLNKKYLILIVFYVFSCSKKYKSTNEYKELFFVENKVINIYDKYKYIHGVKPFICYEIQINNLTNDSIVINPNKIYLNKPNSNLSQLVSILNERMDSVINNNILLRKNEKTNLIVALSSNINEFKELLNDFESYDSFFIEFDDVKIKQKENHFLFKVKDWNRVSSLKIYVDDEILPEEKYVDYENFNVLID